jgi:predicted NBD/HSP70 family sugar kinase
MNGTDEAVVTIAELAERLAGKGKLVAGATQAEVLWQIAQHAGIASRGDIAARSGLSPATVSKAVAILIDEKLVDDTEGGRRRPRAPLRWTERYAAAGVVIVTRDGHPAEFIGTVTMLNGTALPAFADGAKRTPISYEAQKEPEPKGLLEELGQFIKTLLEDAADSTPEARVLGCGVSVGGHVDAEEGIVRKSFNTGWDDDFHLARDLAEWLKLHAQPLDVAVENDVTSYTVHKNLTSRPAKSYVLVAIYRDGIGGGVVVNGRTWRGHQGMAGEIGHIYVGSRDSDGKPQNRREERRKSPLDRRDEPICRCGQVGCLEAWTVPLAIFKRAHPQRAAELASGEQSFEDLFRELASRPADEAVAGIFKEAGTALGRGLADVTLWLNPEKIFLYLPPALVTTNQYLAGKSYLDAVHAELRHVFSIGDATPLDPDPMTELELEELGAKAAASNVLRKLLLKLEDIK